MKRFKYFWKFEEEAERIRREKPEDEAEKEISELYAYNGGLGGMLLIPDPEDQGHE